MNLTTAAITRGLVHRCHIPDKPGYQDHCSLHLVYVKLPSAFSTTVPFTGAVTKPAVKRITLYIGIIGQNVTGRWYIFGDRLHYHLRLLVHRSLRLQ